MAETEQATADYQEHAETYGGFLRLTKWGIGAVVVVLVLMAIFLT